ncbi:LOW QUALITY PROTEIN: solute carrier family 22 member 17 [Fundulus diaphanus]
MTSPDSPPLVSFPMPAPPPSLPSSPVPSSPAPSSSSMPAPPSLPPTGEVMVLALGRKKQRVLIALSILPNLFLAFLLSSDPLLTLSPRWLPAISVSSISCFTLVLVEMCLSCTSACPCPCRLGRSKTLLISLTLSVVFGVLVCVSPYPSIFIVMRFCLAAASAGVYLTLYITRLELCEPSLRLVATMLAGLMTVAGELLLLAVALGCQSWRGLLGAGAAPLTLFLSYGVPGVFPESPRWLLLSERSADMSAFGERRNSSRELRDDESFTELEAEPTPSSRPRLSFPELFHSKNIWKNMFVLGFTSFISHGISHCYSSFRGDVRGTAPSFYWTYLLSVSAGGGAWLLLWATADRCGRRGILLLFMTMTGLASLILLGLVEYLSETAITVFSVLGLFSSQATASLCILFTAEIMPTVIRGCSVGAVLALGCVGRLSSPIMDLRNHYGYFLHHVIYSSLALLAVLSILLLPESKRKPLPQTLADGEQYRRPPLGRRRRDNVPLLATPNPET